MCTRFQRHGLKGGHSRPEMHCFSRRHVGARVGCQARPTGATTALTDRLKRANPLSTNPATVTRLVYEISAHGGHAISSRLQAASSNNMATTTSGQQSSNNDDESLSKQVLRKERLTTLLELRRVYRDILHASTCLEVPSPVYQPVAQPEPKTDSSADSTSAEDEKEREILEQERQNQALAVLAEMQLTSEQLKAGLRTLPPGFGWVFAPGNEDEGEQFVRQAAQDYSSRLRMRVLSELPLLPFGGEQQAQALIDARIARLTRRPPQVVASTSCNTMTSLDLESGSGPANAGPSAIERAEKVAEQFVQTRIKPALRRAREAELGDLLRGAGPYLQGLWIRLNGGGRSGQRGGLEALGLPLPTASRKESEMAMVQITLELEQLEKRLQEASKARENKLRKAGLPGRVQMAVQLKGLDADVLELSQLLAVRTLQLEMEYIFRSLEDEVLDVTGYDSSGVLADREGSTSELALLVADFVLLDEQLMALSQALSSSGAEKASAHASSGSRTLPLSIVGEEILEKLADEIPDMRLRVGVMDQKVFGGQGFSMTRLQLQGQDSLAKVQEAIDFLIRGTRLLGSDVANSGRLFMRAALGGTLKPREVSALRRTARDVLTFIPFSIILIIPLTPLGHVLVFSLIQTYFPSFFPSCFTKKRQDIMIKYEELQRQLLDAQDQAEVAEEEAELARAAAAVARLTAPDDAGSSEEANDASTGRRLAATTGTLSAGGGPSARQNGKAAGTALAHGSTGSGQLSDGGGSYKVVPRDASVQPHVEKVRVLEEELSVVLQRVNLGETAEDGSTSEEEEDGESGMAHNSKLQG